jgi:hypothetical protein
MIANTTRALAIAILFALTITVAAQSPTAGRVPDSQIALDLQARAKTYLDLRKKVAGNAPSSGDSPSAITSAQHELANKIRVARAGARQGDVFTPPIAAYVKKQIAASISGPHGSDIKASLQRAEPVKIQLQVNQSYPENVPLQSTPPSLLMNLPDLPKGLEYRLLGNELVLRDADANVVVDYVPNAVPM